MDTLLSDSVILERNLRASSSKGTSTLSVVLPIASQNGTLISTAEITTEQKFKEIDEFGTLFMDDAVGRVDLANTRSQWLDLASASLFRKSDDRIFLFAKIPNNVVDTLTLINPNSNFASLMYGCIVIEQSQLNENPVSYNPGTGSITLLNGNTTRQFRARVRCAFTTNMNYNGSGASRIGFEIRLLVDFSVPVGLKKEFNQSGNPPYNDGGNLIYSDEFIITTSPDQTTLTICPQIRIPDVVAGLSNASFTRLHTGYYCQYNEFSIEEIL